jgi:muramoyltetrapeptide carboxypeptidase
MLKHGDTIGICAPSGSFDNTIFDKGLEVIRGMGFNLLVPEEIYQKKRYLAGDDLFRADVITRLFSDKEVKGIMCARGGFGAIRILDMLDWDIIKNNPKLFIGFSDITALLMNLINLPAMKVVHGPNITSLANAEQETKDSLYEVLTTDYIGTGKLKLDTPVVINKGAGRGRLVGGNLATLNHLVGTIYQPQLKGCILFIEDIGEPPYKIDRMLTQMKMSGCFEGIKGVIAGSFQDCESLRMVEEIIEEVFKEFNIPVLSGFESGHGRINLSIPLGIDVTLDTENLGMEWNLTKNQDVK